MKIVETQNIERIQNLANKCYMKAYEKIHTVEQNRFSFHEMYSTESLREQIVLNVNRRNDSVAFYQHMGFEISGSWDREIADGRWLMDGYEMRRKFEA